ncbi:PREDICTED: F-box/LRR-repeat [Prunus dulcis]|uniref:PREDICTED: F-box/LRR-repeat n=1 Tax=Prunus dulcis TaxID=3755 RepID=A0A5E4EBH3_PRUDU|nr:hypothetical protein L3X38_035830 [Prunus dulcis]VVA13025.1 PREDICTED: F-box/LRR-repeat [Prunus dulcis]
MGCYNYNLAKRRKTKGEGHNFVLADRISELPDEILVSILSLLSLKEAATTSILSKRWQHLWASTMTLNFDAKLDLGSSNLRHFRGLQPEIRYQESHRYINWVNRVLEQHKGPSIERFRACFDIDHRFTSSIDKWIQFAMTRRVQILELEFIVAFSVIYEGHYAFPYPDLKHLCPSPLHSLGHNIGGFKSLKVLSFRYVDVTGEILEYFLFHCPVLEHLTVRASTNLVNLRVVGSSIALKHLAIVNCFGIKSIQIRDANLVSFVYNGGFVNLDISNVPLLIEVSIFETDDDFELDTDIIKIVLGQLSCVVSQLEILRLDIDQPCYHLFKSKIYDKKYEFPVFANLKHLELIVESDYRWLLHQLNSFIKASPYLQRLALKLQFQTWKCDRKLKKAAICPHHYLKVVEIVGYRARRLAVTPVMHLIKSAVALEKIVIDPVRRWLYPKGMERVLAEVKKEVKARDHAMQHIKHKVPSTIEFVCL